jgi:hypothetical protein
LLQRVRHREEADAEEDVDAVRHGL